MDHSVEIYNLCVNITNMLPEAVICTFRSAYKELIISLFCLACCVDCCITGGGCLAGDVGYIVYRYEYSSGTYIDMYVHCITSNSSNECLFHRL